LLTNACTKQDSKQRFELKQVNASWADGLLQATVLQSLNLSGEARKALVHGVPLTLALDIVLEDSRGRIVSAEYQSTYEIRYLPLSDHYRLTGQQDNTIKNFPRLRHLLAALSTINLSIHTGELPPGSYQLMARTHLDQRQMPATMRLPMLFSRAWHHDSDWTNWPVTIHHAGK